MCNSHITNIPRLHLVSLGLSAADQSRYLLCPLSHTFSAMAVNNGTSLLPTNCKYCHTTKEVIVIGITVAILHNECIVLHIMVRADNSITVTH